MTTEHQGTGHFIMQLSAKDWIFWKSRRFPVNPRRKKKIPQNKGMGLFAVVGSSAEGFKAF